MSMLVYLLVLLIAVFRAGSKETSFKTRLRKKIIAFVVVTAFLRADFIYGYYNLVSICTSTSLPIVNQAIEWPIGYMDNTELRDEIVRMYYSMGYENIGGIDGNVKTVVNGSIVNSSVPSDKLARIVNERVRIEHGIYRISSKLVVPDKGVLYETRIYDWRGGWLDTIFQRYVMNYSIVCPVDYDYSPAHLLDKRTYLGPDDGV